MKEEGKGEWGVQEAAEEGPSRSSVQTQAGAQPVTPRPVTLEHLLLPVRSRARRGGALWLVGRGSFGVCEVLGAFLHSYPV